MLQCMMEVCGGGGSLDRFRHDGCLNESHSSVCGLVQEDEDMVVEDDDDF